MPVLAEGYDGDWWAVDSIPMGSKAWQDTWDGLPSAQRPLDRHVRNVREETAMKAAVFYDVEDIRLEDVPEPEIGATRSSSRSRACGICGSDLEYYYGTQPGRHGRRQGPARPRPRVLRARRRRPARTPSRASPRATASRSTRSRAATRATPRRSGNPHFDLSIVLGVTTNGAFAKYVRTKAEHAYKLPDSLSDEQGAFVEMLRRPSLTRSRRPRSSSATSSSSTAPARSASRWCSSLKASGGARRDRRDARLPARAGEGHGRRPRVQHRRQSSPYYTADLAAAIQGVNGGELADRAIVATASEAPTSRRSRSPATARRSSTWASPGPDDVVKLPMLSSLYHGQDDPLLAGSTRNQWPNDDPPAARGRSSTRRRSSPTRRARRDRRRRSARSSTATTASSRSSSSRRRTQMAKPKFSVSEITTFHQTFERGPRDLRRGGRRGHRHLGVQAARGRRRRDARRS